MNKAVIFDLDGTIYFGETLNIGTLECLNELENLGFDIVFFTNNSTKTREEILSKLTNLGIKTELEKIYTSSYVTAKFLSKQELFDVYLIGSKGFAKELSNFGINQVSPEFAKALVVGLDLNFNYEKISSAILALLSGAKFVVCNQDKNYPVENGILKPGANAMVASILGSLDSARVDYLIGKPNTYILDLICKENGLNSQNIVIVGDSLESDIAMAKSYGTKSILVGKDGLNIVTKTIKGEFYECFRI